MSKKNLNWVANLPFYREGALQKVYRDGNFVYKVVDASKYGVSPDVVVADISNYIASCRKAGVKVPRYVEVPFIVEDNIVVNKYTFEGVPLFGAMSDGKLDKLYLKLLVNLSNGLKGGLGISSFNEQYTFNGKDVVLVDFFVPAIKEAFTRYKKGQEAVNYYVIQFSENSVMLSGLTHYQQLFPDRVEDFGLWFSKFMTSRHKCFPLVKDMLRMSQLKWYMENHESINGPDDRWLVVDSEYSTTYFDSVFDLLRNSDEESLIVNVPRQRLFSKRELKESLNTYLQKYGKN